MAAEGFSNSRKDVIKRALRYVEATGDPEAYTSELSRVFFLHLHQACDAFMDLFTLNTSKQQVGTKNAASTSSTTSVGAKGTSITTKSSTTLAPSSQKSVFGKAAEKLKTIKPSVETVTPSSSDKLSPDSSDIVDNSSSSAAGDLESLSYLVEWIQDQMSLFVLTLSRQVIYINITNYILLLIFFLVDSGGSSTTYRSCLGCIAVKSYANIHKGTFILLLESHNYIIIKIIYSLHQ
jgi:hypothetical protein